MFSEDLKEHYHRSRLIPFIGAGVSMSVSWTQDGKLRRGPSWRELVDEAARKLEFKDPELLRVRGTDLQILEYFKLKNNNEFASLSNWLYAEMRPSDDDLRHSTLHQELAAMERCGVFYTTNYDDFLERSFALHGRNCNAIVVEAHIAESFGNPDLCQVVKFHGDLNHPNEMVLSESDYEKRLTLSEPLDFRLKSDLLGRVLLFIGYSFRDWNVSYLFRLVNEQYGSLAYPYSTTGSRAYIAVPDPSDFEIRLFRARNIEVIPIGSLNQTEDIVALLREIRS